MTKDRQKQRRFISLLHTNDIPTGTLREESTLSTALTGKQLQRIAGGSTLYVRVSIVKVSNT